MLGIDDAFGLVRRHSRHGPVEMFRVGPFGRAAQHEELRHLLAVQVAVHRVVGGGAERAEHQQHLLLLDEFSRLLDRLGRRVRIVEADELDLAAIDAAFGIDLLEIGLLRPADDAEAGCRAAIGQRLPDADFVLGVVADSRGASQQRECDRQYRSRQSHCSRPSVLFVLSLMQVVAPIRRAPASGSRRWHR